MNRVVTINLGGRPYTLEESGYEAVKRYLSDAAAELDGDPGKQDILADIESAIAEKCDKVLSNTKTVVTSEEAAVIIEAMGPVVAEGGGSRNSTGSETVSPAPKRLFKIRDGAIVFGVCSGLSAYFGIDVIAIRVLFVVLALITSGGWALAYLIMAILIPYADTHEEQAEARGESFSAQKLVEEARKNYLRFAKETDWVKLKQDAKESAHEAKRAARKWRKVRRAEARNTSPVFLPFFGIIAAALTVAWLFAILSLIVTGAIFGWALPWSMPLWAAIVALALLYAIIVSPFRIARRAVRDDNRLVYRYPGAVLWDSALGIAFLAIVIWFAYAYIPQAHEWLGTTWSHLQSIFGR